MSALHGSSTTKFDPLPAVLNLNWFGDVAPLDEQNLTTACDLRSNETLTQTIASENKESSALVKEYLAAAVLSLI